MLDVALAHDILEDTDVTEKELAAVLNEFGLEAVKALTRNKDQSYFDYIEKQVLTNPLASLVKLADLEDNIENAIPSLQKRYNKAKKILLDYWHNVVFPPPSTESDEDAGDDKETPEKETTLIQPD